MTVGNPASVAQVNNDLTSLALQIRGLASQVLERQAYLNKLGTAGLNNLGGAGAGFSLAANPANNGGASDAQAVLDDINQMATVVGCYKGTVQQGGTGGTGAVKFNFEDFLTHLWAGQ
jgi:hypothetical protein